MENKNNIFENGNGKKKITYYIVLGLCIIAIGAISFLSYKSMQDKLSNTPIENTPIENDPVDTTVEDVKDNGTEDVITQEPAEETVTPKVEEQPPVIETKKYIMPIEGEIQTGYSLEVPVYSNTLKDWRIHDGIDIAAPAGTNVVCVNDGVVESVECDDLYGITVCIKHTDGKKSYYSNLEDSVELEEGQIINIGDTVGKVGNTAVFEIADGSHLHFEMSENDKKIDPLSVIK